MFGGQLLFRGANWFVGPRDRVALIGPNGSGKTTLLRVIAGLDGVETGSVEIPKTCRVGYLAQNNFVIGKGTVREEARKAFDEVLGVQEELQRLEVRLARSRPEDAGLTELTVQHGELLDRLAILGTHEIDRQVHQVLTGLGFRQADFDRSVATLSGGWQIRAALARILLQKPQVLLLDEPTNHLDIEAREWLEGYLQAYPYAFAVVSHDRYFLDVTVKRVSEIVTHRLDEYAGNYSYYETEREKRLALRMKAYERQQDEIRRTQRFIDRFRSDKRRAAQVQSRIRILRKMERLEPVKQYRRSIAIRYPECPSSGRIVLELRGIRKAYGDVRVFDGMDLRILRGARVALVGLNGAGKSTLMRMLAGQERPDAGERIVGYRLAPGFFAQEQGFRMDGSLTVLETMTARAPIDFIPQVRSLLGAFLFSGDSVDKKVSVLSGGELNRLALACLLVSPSNLLLLDEPTNHLDIPSKDVLLQALSAYRGTVVFVSHDRRFLDALATDVIDVAGGVVREYPGGYAEYLWAQRRAKAAAAGEKRSGAAGEPRAASPSRGRGSGGRFSGKHRKDARVEDAEARRRRIAEIESEIAELEDRKRRYVEVMGSPDFFANEMRSRVYQKEYQEVEEKLTRLVAEWEKLSE
jgi:ATP-binding cassette subfamily F protein 3